MVLVGIFGATKDNMSEKSENPQTIPVETAQLEAVPVETEQPETIQVEVAEIQRHNQLLTSLAMALNHLLSPNQGVVVALNGQLHVVYRDADDNIHLEPINSNEQLVPGTVLNINPPQAVEAEPTAEAPASDDSQVVDDVVTVEATEEV